MSWCSITPKAARSASADSRDDSLPAYDEGATRLLTRVLSFLDDIE